MKHAAQKKYFTKNQWSNVNHAVVTRRSYKSPVLDFILFFCRNRFIKDQMFC